MEQMKQKLNKPLEFFVVQNQEGNFFRAKGYGGSGDTWVDDINKAKVYAKLSQARSRVTWFAHQYPDYGIPKIIKFVCDEYEVLEEIKRVTESIQKKELRTKTREKEYAEWRLKQYQEDVVKYQKEIDELKKKFNI